jgi:hypothetical protein
MKQLFLFVALFATQFLAAQNSTNGYLFSTSLNVNETLRTVIPQKDFNGYTNAKTKRGKKLLKEKGIYSGEEVNSIMQAFATAIQGEKKVEKVAFAKALSNESVKKNMRGLGKNILNEGALEQSATYYTMNFFPELTFKKAKKTTAKTYYSIKVKVKSGGSASPMIVMNKVKRPAYVKYAVDVTILAKDAKKKKLWTKKATIKDFSAKVDGTAGKRFFKLEGKRTLSLSDIEASIILAVQEALKQ